MKKIVLGLGVGTLSALIIASILPQSTAGALDIWMLNIGQGESVFIHEPTGENLLFDGGPDDSVLSELGSVMPPWQRSIDLVVLSHPHADHVRGLLSVLDRYQVKQVWSSGTIINTADFRQWIFLLKRENIPVKHVHAYHSETLGSLHLEVYHPLTDMTGQMPEETHDGDVSLKVSYEDFSIFLAGDLNEGHESNMLASCQPPTCNLQSTILQVPHHGSATGLSINFLKAINPRLALIPVGLNNDFGHPRPEILAKLTNAHIPIFRTDTEKRIHVIYHSGVVNVSAETGENLQFNLAEVSVPP